MPNVINEASWFRLVLLVVGCAVLGFGGASYSKQRSSAASQDSLSWQLDEMRRLDVDCDAEHRTAHSLTCEGWPKRHQEAFDLTARERDEAASDARRFRQLALAIPMLSLVCFYALRWALFGRLRPIWPLGGTRIK